MSRGKPGGPGKAAGRGHTGKFLRIAVNVPVSGLFDYLPPARPGGSLLPGSRVSVPFGRRTVTGLVVEQSDSSDLPKSRLRRVRNCLDATPLLREADLWLIRFASDYYHHPIGEVAAAAMPALLRLGRNVNPTLRQLRLLPAGEEIDREALQKRAPKQAAVIDALRSGPLSFEALDERLGNWRATRKALLQREWIELVDTEIAEPATQAGPATGGPLLNSDQSAAVREIGSDRGFGVTLLDGVTGSGKTEVYLRLMSKVLEAGRQVLILVPEIGLTPQLIQRLGARLGQEPVVFHSTLSDAARLASWRRARSGAARVILGTRSAIFMPLANPGLIVVDEEHDNSLKQQEGFRYSARDLAIARGKFLDVPVILGTATPSLESLQRCHDGAYRHLRLPARAAAIPPPRMRLIDLNVHATADGISDAAIMAIRETTGAGSQALLFLNRRGFAPTLICGACGHIAECSRCDARMTVHAGADELRCHHCGASRRIDELCTECGGRYRALGQGTERLEDRLRQEFPGTSIARVDSDSMRTKGTMDEALSRATRGETRILVGTQMLSKGHHFPNLHLVVVVNADQGLFSSDFRSGEKLAQSLVQVAGRAGREQRQGEVLIQTAFPSHAFWSELFRGGYERVAKSALDERRRSAWPPFSRLALVRASALKREDAHAFLARARVGLESGASGDTRMDVRILGPVSAPMERRAGRYRAQLLVQSVNRQALHRLLATLRVQLENDRRARRVRWSIDVDPVELF